MYNRKLAKLLKHSYKILAVILILLAGGLLLIPQYEQHEGIDPDSLLANAISPERYISSDELAHKIISEDPSVLVIDVRDSARFNAYSIPGAIHIPLREILKEENEAYFSTNAYEIVLCSDDNFYADQAWILLNRLGNKNLRVLEGGMQSWFNSVINPPVPEESMSASAHELYSFRKSASMYFGVAYPDEIESAPPPPPVQSTKPKVVTPVKKKKKKMPEGGC
jgi:rhodanese-related sulfurtransferase